MAKAKKSKKIRKRRSSAGPLDWRNVIDTIGPCPTYSGAHTVEAAAQVARQRVGWQLQVKALIETYRRRQRQSDVEMQQESHSPTVEIAVDDPDATRKVRRNLTRVRQSEAWRHNRLSGMQRDAEKEMEFAWRQRTTGLGAASSRYGETRGGSNRADLGAGVDETWCAWAALTKIRRVMLPAVVDCLAEPKTLAEIERDYRMRRGQAFDNYVSGLDLWCEVRGWIRGPRMDGGPHLIPEGVAS